MPSEPDSTTMPLTAHLEELRWRILKALGATTVGFMLTYGFAELLFSFLTAPLITHVGDSVNLIGTGVTEAFFTKLKVSLIAAVFVASPVIFYQLWAFISPGLYDSEKRHAKPFVIFSTLFFSLGAGFCYYLVFPFAFEFFVEEFMSIGVNPELRIGEYLGFASRMLLAFGVIFELPVLTYFLARVGVVNHRLMIAWARYAFVGSFVVAAILTPADAASQFLMAGPLIILYLISIGVAYLIGRETITEEVPDEPEDDDK